MKVIILAGGFGTRLSEYTDIIPKPMVKIGDKPILFHIMNHYAKYGHKDFYIALGYKSQVIKDFFINFKLLNSDFSVDLKSGNIEIHSDHFFDWKVTLVETGLDSMTGGRVKRFSKFINEGENFLLTYGDGLSDVNINKLVNFHLSHNKIGTVTAVRPGARFGELEIEKDLVKSFKEKPQTTQGWINGGFFVFKRSIFNYIDDDSTILEQEPLENLSKNQELLTFKHEGFWQCMDSKRDKDYLEEIWTNGKAPWG